MTFITITDVRTLSGADSDLIDYTQVQNLIDIVEKQTAKWLNTKFVPTRRIDIINGNGQDWIFSKKNPLLALRSLKSNGSTADVSTTHMYRQSGKIQFGEDSTDVSLFVRKLRSVIIDYLFGWVEQDDDTTTTTSADATAGSSVNIEVADSSDFTVADWVDIYGTDGNQEVAQITALPDGTHITVDQILYDHDSDSIIAKMVIPEFVKGFMRHEAAIAVATYATGNTYTFNASYSLGELSIVKGVPHTHWSASYRQNVQQRNYYAERLKPRPSILVN